MRHVLCRQALTLTVTAGAFGVSKTPAATVLITPASLP